MSAFFLAINRNNRQFEPWLAQRMMAQLDRFGHASRQLTVNNQFAIGHQTYCVMPAASQTQQPMKLGEHLYFLFHGRVDNRSVMLEKLGLEPTQSISDADIVARCYRAFGDECLDEFRGPFVFVFFNESNNEVVACRDAMGGRYLVYRVTEKHILIATYEMALVAHNSLHYTINEEKAARYLSNQMESQPSSLIDGLTPLNPGTKLTVNEAGVRLHRYYSYSPATRIHLDSDQSYADEFKRLLNQAISRRTANVARPGLMLSGGLDSIPIAILAAQQSPSLIALSWVFDQYPELDERQYSSPICQQLGIEQVMINCDERWPQWDQSMDLNPIVPFGIPFSEFQEATFRKAKSKGVTMMLTGIHGDLLYEYTNGILYELLKAGEFRRFYRELKLLWTSSSSTANFIRHYCFRPIKLAQKLGVVRRKFAQHRHPYLQDRIGEKVCEKPHWLLAESARALRPKQWQIVLDGFAGDDTVHGRYLEAKYGIERRYPFRDRDLCEFMLSIPSHQLYFSLQKRPIVKQAFAQEFNENLLARNNKTSFSQVIYSGVSKDKKNRQWFESQPPQWADYVKQCYFESKTAQNGSMDVVRWRCGYYDYWKSVCYNPLMQELRLSDENKNEDK